MAEHHKVHDAFAEEDSGPVLTRRPLDDKAELDITPMIDITFLLLIFFLVASIPDPQNSVELPPARHGQGISKRTSFIVTVAERDGSGSALVYLGDGKSGELLPDDPAAQEERIAAEVETAFHEGKSNVLVKAGRGVLHGEVSRIAAAVGRVKGIKLHLAVLEVE